MYKSKIHLFNVRFDDLVVIIIISPLKDNGKLTGNLILQRWSCAIIEMPF